MDTRINTQESHLDKFNDELTHNTKKTSANTEEVKVIETKVAKDHQGLSENKKNVQSLDVQSKQHQKTLEMLQNEINALKEQSQKTITSLQVKSNQQASQIND